MIWERLHLKVMEYGILQLFIVVVTFDSATQFNINSPREVVTVPLDDTGTEGTHEEGTVSGEKGDQGCNLRQGYEKSKVKAN